MLDKQEAGHVADEHLKDQMAAVHSQVWLNTVPAPLAVALD